jgi:hypothetical protein
MVNCDDYGITDARPSILRAKCYPLKIDKITEEDIEKWLSSLCENNLIFIYIHKERPYLKMTTWGNHQQIRAKRSKYPLPDDKCSNMISNDIKRNQLTAYVPENPIQSESNPNPINTSCGDSEESPPADENIQDDNQDDLQDDMPDEDTDEKPGDDPPKIKHDEDSLNYRAAVYLRKKITDFNPKCKVPPLKVEKMQKWSDDIRKILELDKPKRTKEDLKDVINFTFKDTFWCSVIQSPSGLREHFDQIYGKMKVEYEKGQKDKSKGSGRAPSQQGNYQQRKYDDAYYEKLYKNTNDAAGSTEPEKPP